VPRLAQAQWLVRHLRVHAMIDLSDGLASDLWQMARASRATLQVREADIPVSRAARTLRHALMDGEDFELLFAVPPRQRRRVPKRLEGVPVTEIGVVAREGRSGVELMQRNGRRRPLVPQGFKHF
jgi:thiamine-monophosphate kinase